MSTGGGWRVPYYHVKSRSLAEFNIWKAKDREMKAEEALKKTQEAAVKAGEVAKRILDSQLHPGPSAKSLTSLVNSSANSHDQREKTSSSQKEPPIPKDKQEKALASQKESPAPKNKSKAGPANSGSGSVQPDPVPEALRGYGFFTESGGRLTGFEPTPRGQKKAGQSTFQRVMSQPDSSSKAQRDAGPPTPKSKPSQPDSSSKTQREASPSNSESTPSQPVPAPGPQQETTPSTSQNRPIKPNPAPELQPVALIEDPILKVPSTLTLSAASQNEAPADNNEQKAEMTTSKSKGSQPAPIPEALQETGPLLSLHEPSQMDPASEAQQEAGPPSSKSKPPQSDPTPETQPIGLIEDPLLQLPSISTFSPARVSSDLLAGNLTPDSDSPEQNPIRPPPSPDKKAAKEKAQDSKPAIGQVDKGVTIAKESGRRKIQRPGPNLIQKDRTVTPAKTPHKKPKLSMPIHVDDGVPDPRNPWVEVAPRSKGSQRGKKNMQRGSTPFSEQPNPKPTGPATPKKYPKSKPTEPHTPKTPTSKPQSLGSIRKKATTSSTTSMGWASGAKVWSPEKSSGSVPTPSKNDHPDQYKDRWPLSPKSVPTTEIEQPTAVHPTEIAQPIPIPTIVIEQPDTHTDLSLIPQLSHGAHEMLKAAVLESDNTWRWSLNIKAIPNVWRKWQTPVAVVLFSDIGEIYNYNLRLELPNSAPPPSGPNNTFGSALPDDRMSPAEFRAFCPGMIGTPLLWVGEERFKLYQSLSATQDLVEAGAELAPEKRIPSCVWLYEVGGGVWVYDRGPIIPGQEQYSEAELVGVPDSPELCVAGFSRRSVRGRFPGVFKSRWGDTMSE
ncbi:MAG: hypothetical protein M1814_001011 [Vezdaea aestivalis]|nr:MAG: hypothetical protein M1814_001011 [Vezdaea aestivalis]